MVNLPKGWFHQDVSKTHPVGNLDSVKKTCTDVGVKPESITRYKFVYEPWIHLSKPHWIETWYEANGKAMRLETFVDKDVWHQYKDMMDVETSDVDKETGGMNAG